MRARQKVTRAGIELIASFEGLRRRAARLPDGRWTIGYGHTLSAREGAEVSPEDAEALLHFDLLPIAEALNNLVYTPLTQNQFDALVAFAFNIGIDAFRTSDVLKRVNEGRLTEAACALDLWRKAELSGDPVILDALIRRRSAEKALFLTPHGGFVPTPSPLLRPMVDETLAPALPQSRPADIEVPMEGDDARVHRLATPVEVSPEPVELTESEAEPIDSLPMESEAVETIYSDDIPVETDQELEIQALEAAEPGAEAMTPEAAEADVAEADIAEAGPAETEPAETASAEAEPAELQTDGPAVAEPAPEQPVAAQAEAVPAAAAPADRLYAPESAGEPDGDFDAPAVAAAVQAAPPAPSERPLAQFGYSQAPLSPGWRVGPVIRAGDAPPEDALVLTPPPAVEELTRATPEPEPEAPGRETDELQTPLFDETSEAEQAAGHRIIRHEDITADAEPLERPSMGPFILMGAIGMVAFGGAISAFIKGSTDGGANGLTMIAWLLALIGAACAGTAVYFLLKRLGGVED